jgi:hypothetical protein
MSGAVPLVPTLRYALTDADQLALVWDRTIRRWLYVVAFVAALGVLGIVASGGEPAMFVAAGASVAFGALFLASIWCQTRSKVLAELRARPLHGIALTIDARPEGLEITGPEPILHSWTLVGAPSTTHTSITLPVGQVTKVLIPRRVFAHAEAERAFIDAIARGRASPPVPLPEPGDDGPYTYDLSYRSSFDDLLALNSWFMYRHEPPGQRRAYLALMVLCTLGSLVLVAIVGPKAMLLPILLGGMSLALTARGRKAIVWFNVWRLVRNGGPARDEGSVRLRARPSGVAYRGHSALTSSWSLVVQVVDHTAHVFVFNGPNSAWIIPKSAFTGPEQVTAFVNDVNAWVAAAGPFARPPVPRAEAADSSNPFQAPGAE